MEENTIFVLDPVYPDHNYSFTQNKITKFPKQKNTKISFSDFHFRLFKIEKNYNYNATVDCFETLIK